MLLNVNTDAVVSFTNTLEKMTKSAFPFAIRNTLNSMALDVKMKTMPAQAQKAFVNREKTFFKSQSRVQFASGYNINAMKSTVGFISSNLKYNNYAVKDLEDQEEGGEISNRTFVPTNEARLGKNKAGKITARTRLKRINRIVDASKVTGKSPQVRFIHAVHEAGKGGFVLSGKKLWRIDSISKKGKIKKTYIYSFKKGRKVKVKPTYFMRKASELSAKKGEMLYIDNVKRTIAKYK